MDRVGAQADPRILGLTGPIGCGKTTVGTILLELGAAERIDADALVHELMQAGTVTTERIAAAFGAEAVRPDGSVDRPQLGRIVFGDPEALRRLETIVHPGVRDLVRQRLRDRAGGDGVVVLDAVKLLQSEILDLVEAVWVVRCPRAEEARRLIELRGLTPADAEARIEAQPPFDHPRVTRVIDNSGTPADLRRQVEEAWKTFLTPV